MGQGLPEQILGLFGGVYFLTFPLKMLRQNRKRRFKSYHNPFYNPEIQRNSRNFKIPFSILTQRF
jgi:hypothetical protein